MDEPEQTGDSERDLVLLELQASVVMAIREGEFNEARHRCTRFGRGPEVCELRGLVEQLSGNHEQAAEWFNDAKLGYLHEERYRAAAVASVKKVRVHEVANEPEEKWEAQDDAKRYYSIYHQRTHPSLFIRFDAFFKEQYAEYCELEQSLTQG